MHRSKSFHWQITFVSMLSFFAVPLLLGQDVADTDFIASAKTSLRDFEKWHWGLRFEVQVDELNRTTSYWSSLDGQFFRKKSETKYDAGISISESYATSEKNYLFTTAYMNRGKSRNNLVFFANPGYRAEGILQTFDVKFGLVNARFLTEVVDESRITRIEKLIRGETYQGIAARHEKYGNLELLFDSAMNLVFLTEQLSPGNVYLSATKYLPCNFDQTVSYGPITYGTFSGRKVLESVPVRASNSNAGISEFICQFQNYAETESTLGPKIEVSGSVKLKDGEIVHNPDKPAGSFLLRDREVVLAIDSLAMDAADQAEFVESSSIHYYFILSVAFLGVFCFFVWVRNRHA